MGFSFDGIPCDWLVDAMMAFGQSHQQFLIDSSFAHLVVSWKSHYSGDCLAYHSVSFGLHTWIFSTWVTGVVVLILVL